MDRRSVLLSTLAVAALTASITGMAEARENRRTPPQQYYELRVYTLPDPAKRDRLEAFWRDAAIPALRRLNYGPVGLFREREESDAPKLYVLLTASSPEMLLNADRRLEADAQFRKSGAEFLRLPPNDPPYARYESSLMAAFSGMPRLEVPAAAKADRPRLLELRTYESHSERAHLKKVEMFDTGEIDLFRRTGLTPVFFGRTLIGPRMPNLTYMLVFDDMADHDRSWKTFVNHPEWKKMSATPGYTDKEIVSGIRRVFLVPAPGSQI
ncbi:MAG: NIPSNAP family protein [Armatimonadetes bacterium]|nr:NIPSNAP family protein [Armatimonadota bacterium]